MSQINKLETSLEAKTISGTLVTPMKLSGSLGNSFVMSKIVVDTELNGESENPIANKAVYEAIQQCKANQEEIGKFFENGKLSHTLTIGNTIYDGTKDVIIKVYDGEKNII